jgi:hypothetical protein
MAILILCLNLFFQGPPSFPNPFLFVTSIAGARIMELCTCFSHASRQFRVYCWKTFFTPIVIRNIRRMMALDNTNSQSQTKKGNPQGIKLRVECRLHRPSSSTSSSAALIFFLYSCTRRSTLSTTLFYLSHACIL